MYNQYHELGEEKTTIFQGEKITYHECIFCHKNILPGEIDPYGNAYCSAKADKLSQLKAQLNNI
jgi:hypothetical protein